MRSDAAAVALLVALVVVAHGAVTSQWWLWDDPQLLYGAMRFDVLDHFFSPHAWRQQSSANFVPMLQLDMEVDLALFGVAPRGFYVHHLAVLAAAVLAVYGYLRTFVGPILGATAAATFALSQPAFTVASLLMDRHYAAGLLAAAMAMILFRRDRAVAGAAVYLVACLEKEVYVSLPLLIVVQALVTRRGWRTAAAHGALCAVATSAYVAWRMSMLGSFGGFGGEDASLRNVIVRGWSIVSGTRGTVPAIGMLVLALALAVLAARRAPRQAAVVMGSAVVVLLIPLAGLVSLDSRYFFMAAATIIVLAALAVHNALETALFAALCLGIAIGGVAHGIRFRRDLALQQRDGRYLWSAASNASPLFSGADGWYLEGMRWLRREVKGDEAPAVVASIPGLVIARLPPPAAIRQEYEVVRAHAVPDMPLTVQLSLRDSVLHWSFGPAAEGDAFFFVTPIQELIWTRKAVGWVRLPAEVRVPTAMLERHRTVRVLRRSGDFWTVSAELPMPEEGKPVRWTRP